MKSPVTLASASGVNFVCKARVTAMNLVGIYANNGPCRVSTLENKVHVPLAPTIFLMHFTDLSGVFSNANDIVVELRQVACCR